MVGHENAFAGGVFSDGVEGGRAAADITLTRDAVVATTRDGQLFRVPYARCELSRGGASGRMWFCRTQAPDVTVFCEAPDFAQALARAGQGQLGQKMEQLLAEAAGESRRRAFTWLIVLGFTAALIAGLYFGGRQLGRASLDALPRSIDEQIGEVASESMDLHGPVVEDPIVTKALEGMLKRLDAGAKHGFTFRLKVVDAPIVNAYALPGGHMVVYTGLIRAAQRPEQLAGVLAHEMAHVTRRHGMQRIAQSLGVVAAIQLFFGDVSGVAAIAVEVLREGTINSYSREAEHEADMDAVQTLARAKVDPNALAEFFTILQKREGDLPGMLSWLGTHPNLTQRIADVKAAAAKAKVIETEPLVADWKALQERTGEK